MDKEVLRIEEMDREYEQLLGQVHYREKRKDVHAERDEYKKALEDILNAHTVGKMIEIADRVLKENRK